MKKVKWLYALFFALTFTLISEATGAFVVDKNLGWYASLTTPVFTLPPVLHSAIWCAVYVAEAYVISGLLVENRFRPFVQFYVSVKFLAALWTTAFFGLHCTLAGLVILTVILAINWLFGENVLKVRRHPLKKYLVLICALWYEYLWILNYSIIVLN